MIVWFAALPDIPTLCHISYPVTPLGLFSDSTFLASCHPCSYWSHSRFCSCFPKGVQLLACTMSLTNFELTSLFSIQVVNKNTKWEQNRTSLGRAPREMSVCFYKNKNTTTLRGLLFEDFFLLWSSLAHSDGYIQPSFIRGSLYTL